MTRRRYSYIPGLHGQLRGLPLDTLLLCRAFHYFLMTLVQLYHEQLRRKKITRTANFTSKVVLNAFLFPLKANCRSGVNTFTEWMNEYQTG